MDRYAGSLPGVNVTLHYDHNKAGFYLAPRLDSVFAIANYALMRMMATNAPNLDSATPKPWCPSANLAARCLLKPATARKCVPTKNARGTAMPAKWGLFVSGGS